MKMRDDTMTLSKIHGVPVVNKHTILFNGLQQHNIVELHFWRLKSNRPHCVALFAREWLGAAPRGLGSNGTNCWYPMEIRELEGVFGTPMLSDHKPLAPLSVLHKIDADPSDSWNMATHEANMNNRLFKMFEEDYSRGKGISVNGCQFLLITPDLARVIWEKVYARVWAHSPDVSTRTFGELTSHNSCDETQWNRIKQVSHPEDMKSQPPRLQWGSRNWNIGVDTALPDFTTPRILTEDLTEQEMVSDKQKFYEIMQGIENFINNSPSKTTNYYALDA
jgi:hypothetical protein